MGASISRLANKTAIVTGGTSGIGRQIVETFCAEGARVVFTGRDLDRGRAVTDKTGAIFVNADAAALDDPARVVTAAADALGTIDILVNNAGTHGPPLGIENFSIAPFDDGIAVHLRSPWQFMSLCVPLMRKSGGGSIVNISSIAGHRVCVSSLPYAISKAAVLHLTRYAATELGKDKIRVNSISPGLIAMTKKGQQPADAMFGLDLVMKVISRQALRQAGRVIDVAQMALYLASDESAFVTGSDFVIDGGTLWGSPDPIGI
ncbi:MAG: hypothetical protein BGP08_00305 [Rhizobiales bacterium 64-17]|nr:MAG: hypothetical protein BGP08_00305 [Rhizobiales bacterium 64-17]